jgi:hypothetical protein
VIVPSAPKVLVEDALSGLLLPFWQLIIGGLVLVAILGSVQRLARRGHSRMTTALLVTGGAILGVAVLGMLFQGQ